MNQLINGDVPHPGICDRCAAEFHGDCLLAQKRYLQYETCKCRRRGCRNGKKQKRRATKFRLIISLQEREQ